MNSVRLHYLCLEEGCTAPAIEDRIEDKRVQQWMSELSAEKQHSLQRLAAPRNRMISLLALRLLKSCAADEGIEDFHLKDICYPEAGKPYWSASGNSDLPGAMNATLDFNITHSANLIAVAVSRDVRLGVDAERHRKLKRLNFKMVLSDDELALVENSEQVFFDLWSKKEAVVKAADTRGIARMRDVTLGREQSRQHRQAHEELAELDGEIWWILPVWQIQAGRAEVDQTDAVQAEADQTNADQFSSHGGVYSIHLATSAKIDTLLVERKVIDRLL